MKHIKSLTRIEPAKAAMPDFLTQIMQFVEALLSRVKGVTNPHT